MREKVEAVGYLMRTTAVYGSGKFGAADRESDLPIARNSKGRSRRKCSRFLTRAYVLDLVEHLASCQVSLTRPCAIDLR